MSANLKRLRRGLVAAILALPLALYGGQDKGFDYEFTQNGQSYNLIGQFRVKVDLDCLMDVVYGFEHISRFASGADSVELVREGDVWQEVAYTYRRLLILESRTTWRRTLDREGRRVTFRMLTSRNSSRIMPRVLSAGGHYQVDRDRDTYRLKYFQYSDLEGGIMKGRSIERARREAVGFLAGFREYVEDTCGQTGS